MATHDWTKKPSSRFTFCKACLTVRQADGSSDSRPCRGKVGLSLRGALVPVVSPGTIERGDDGLPSSMSLGG